MIFQKNKFSKLILILLIIIPMSISINSEEKPETKSTGVTLNVLTRYASDVFKPFRDTFLVSDLAIDNNIDSVIFWAKTPAEWIDASRTSKYDIAWGMDSSLFNLLDAENLLIEINDPGILTATEGIEETFAGTTLRKYNSSCASKCVNPVWIASSINSYGFIVNLDKLIEKGLDAPRTWSDLARPMYFNSTNPLIGIGNAADFSTSSTIIYEKILQTLGWEAGWALITSIAGNSKIYYSMMIPDIIEEFAIKLSIDTYGVNAQLSAPSIEFIVPEDQSIITTNPIALLKNGNESNRDGVNAFVEFVLSQAGQQIWLKDTINKLPSREDVFDTPIGLTRTDLYKVFNFTRANSVFKFNNSFYLSHKSFLINYFQSTITDIHTELKEGWEKIVNAYKEDKFNLTTLSDWIYSFGHPLVTLEEAIELNNKSSDPTLKSRWSSDMKGQYIAVGEESTKLNTMPNWQVDFNYFPLSSSEPTHLESTSSNSFSIAPKTQTSGSEYFYMIPLFLILVSMRRRKK